MRKASIVVMIFLVAVLFVSGCADKQEKVPGTVKTGDAGKEDTLGQEVSNVITDADSTGSELQDADVENLDTEFENIDW